MRPEEKLSSVGGVGRATVGTTRVTNRERLFVVAVVLAAALLRSWELDLMSIWQDEGLSLYRSGLDLAGVVSGAIPLGDHMTWDVHPPLYFLLLAFWRQLGGWLEVGGSTIWAAKWLSLLASLPAVPLVWALGRRLVGWRTGIVSATLAAASPLYLWYAQEVRSYTLVVTLGLLAVYLLARALEPAIGGRRRALFAVGCAIASAALIWTHYLGFLVAAFEILAVGAVALRARGTRALIVVGAVAAAGLAALPLLPFAMWRLGVGAERDQHFVPLDVMLADVLRGFGLGRTFYLDEASAAGRISLVAIAVFAVLLVVGALHAWRRRRASALFLAGYLLVPVVGLYVLTHLKPVYLGSYHLIAASPAFYILVGAGVAAVARRSTAAGALAAAAALAPMLIAGTNFYTDPRYHKDDLRALAEYVDSRAVPGDVLAVSDPVLERSFEHLVRRASVVSEPRMVLSGLLDDRPPEERLEPLLAAGGRLWFMKPLNDDRAWLESHAALVDREDFRGAGIPVYVLAFERDREPTREPAREPVPEAAGDDLGLLHLQSWDIAPDPLQAGRAARVGLSWEASAGLPDYKVALRLLDAEGHNWAQGDHEPFHGERPTSGWPTRSDVYEPHDLLVDPAAPPGDYRLAVTVYDAGSGEAFPADGPLELGGVTVTRPSEPIDPQSVSVGNRTWVNGPGLALFGYDIAADGAVAGGDLPVTLWVAVTEPAAAGSAMRVDLLDGRGSAIASTGASVGEGALPGEIRRLDVDLPIPADGGRLGVRARVLDEDRKVSWLRRGVLPLRGAWLGQVTVPEPEPYRSAGISVMERRFDVSVGDSIVLLGADGVPSEGVLEETAARHPISIRLLWQATGDVPTGYHVSVQLVPAVESDVGPGGVVLVPAGPPVAQHDGPPAFGSRPTTSWREGEIIVDDRFLTMPDDLSPGTYLLIAALYDPEAPDQPRPAVRQDGREQDYVILGEYEAVIEGPTGSDR